MIEWKTKVHCNYCGWDGTIANLACVCVPAPDGDIMKEIGCLECRSHLFLMEVNNEMENNSPTILGTIQWPMAMPLLCSPVLAGRIPSDRAQQVDGSL